MGWPGGGRSGIRSAAAVSMIHMSLRGKREALLSRSFLLWVWAEPNGWRKMTGHLRRRKLID